MKSPILIFTDLDGTLLDEKYSYQDTLQVLTVLKRKKVPIIFCSGKTKDEQEVIKTEMGVNDPFIVEDGSAIYIPKGYFKEKQGELVGNYEVIVLGVKFENIINEIKVLKRKYMIKNFFDISDQEVAELTGLSLEGAKLAKDREFSETVVEADEKALKELKKKFNVAIGGKFIHVFGKGADKGKAVKLLTDIFRKDFRNVKTVGIGNSYTDEPMLKAVQIPAIVKNPDGNWANLKIDEIYKADSIGPKGWTEVVRKFVLEE